VSSRSSRLLRASIEAKRRALVEQIPAVLFMAYLDQGTGELPVKNISAALLLHRVLSSG
jgi:hypothetical protein